MKYLMLFAFLAFNMAFANGEIRPSNKVEQTVLSEEGINFQDWESEFDSSIKKAKVKVRKCENKSRNCQFEKFQALDPSFDMVQ